MDGASLGGQASLSRGAGRLSRCRGSRPAAVRVGPSLAESRGCFSGALCPVRGRPYGSDYGRPSGLVLGRPAGSEVILFISFDLSFKRKERGK